NRRLCLLQKSATSRAVSSSVSPGPRRVPSRSQATRDNCVFSLVSMFPSLSQVQYFGTEPFDLVSELRGRFGDLMGFFGPRLLIALFLSAGYLAHAPYRVSTNDESPGPFRRCVPLFQIFKDPFGERFPGVRPDYQYLEE